LFEETADRIGPIINFRVNDLNQISAALVAAHQMIENERIWKQNHVLYSVPVSEVKYQVGDAIDRQNIIVFLDNVQDSG